MSLLGRLLQQKRKKFILALGGGGGRGLAHLGVLEVLEEHKLKPSAIIGTSIGALFGAMYALHPSVRDVRKEVESFLRSDAFVHLDLPVLDEADATDTSWLSRLTSAARQSVLYARAATDTAVANVEDLVDVVGTLCRGSDFSEAEIPLYITAVRFPSGECHLFSQGDLLKAVAASMAIPGVFSPIEINGDLYVDGGLASELPAREATMIAKKNEIVVAVNVGTRPDPKLKPSHVISMLDWSTRVKSLYLRRYERGFADVLIEPLVAETEWHDFSNPEQEIERGREAAHQMMPELMKQLGL